MALTVERARELVVEFCQTYPAALQVGFRIRSTAEQLYGAQHTSPNLEKIVGAFVPGTRPDIPGRCDLACANALHDDDFRQTLRHELLGHFGINSFQPTEKRILLSTIVRSRQEPGLARLWAIVDQVYPEAPTMRRAEEVFCLACEAINQLPARAPVLRDGAILPTTGGGLWFMSIDELQAMAELVAHKMTSRHLVMQTIPASERDQFDRPNVVSDGHFIGTVVSVSDGWIEQRIGRAGGSVFHAQELLSVAVARAGDVLEVRYSQGHGHVIAPHQAKGLAR